MNNDFDSRALGPANCYAQRFMRAGVFRYALVPGYAQAISTDFPFVINVVEGDAKKQDSSPQSADINQHNLSVSRSDRGFAVDRASLTIGIGDLVMWNGGRQVPFAVAGEADFFNSYRMVNECGYTHAFGKAGTYEWRDAFGSDLGGTVHVRDPDCKSESDLRKWREALSEGTVVMIADGKVDQREIKIMTGQTVYFAIVKTNGISITDVRLLDQPWLKSDPCSNRAA